MNYIILTAEIIGAVSVIVAALKKILSQLMQPITTIVQNMDVRQCRMWLVDFLNDVDNGVEKDEVQYKFAHEVYDHYTNDLKENSYIHDKWERVMK